MKNVLNGWRRVNGNDWLMVGKKVGGRSQPKATFLFTPRANWIRVRGYRRCQPTVSRSPRRGVSRGRMGMFIPVV